jgi:hypothetical protein
MLDAYANALIARNPNCIVAWWIMACWAYEDGNPIVSDGCFDAIAGKLAADWDEIHHRHKTLLDRGAIKGRLGMTGSWPGIAVSAARHLQSNK